MTPSPWLYDFLKSYEKFRPTAYKPTPKDVFTIGYGHTQGVKKGDTCTTTQAQAWLVGDVAWASAAVIKNVTARVSQNQFDAMVSLCFNIGATHFAGSDVVHLVNIGHAMAHPITAAFDAWDHQAGEVLPGLLRRREAEAQRFLTA